MKKLTNILAAIAFMFGTTSTNAQGSTKIGSQTWATRDLNVSTFRNGEAITEAKTFEEWKKAGDEKEPAWCYLDNNPANDSIYGKLYNWYAVTDSRGLAPKGWHIPSQAEWVTLVDYLGGEKVAGGKLKETGTKHWKTPNTGATNVTGFRALPGGARFGVDGKFDNFHNNGYWWSSTEANTTIAWSLWLYHNSIIVYNRILPISEKNVCLSVRCLRD